MTHNKQQDESGQSNETLPDAFFPISVDGRSRNALRVTAIYLIVAIVALVGELLLAQQNRDWRLVLIASLGAVVVGIAAISFRLVQKGRPNLGVKLLVGGLLGAVIITPLLVAGFGLLLGLGTMLATLTIAVQTLSRREAHWILLISVSLALVAGLIDYVEGINPLFPGSRIDFPLFQWLLTILGSILISAYGILTLHQFNTYPISTKLILAFLAVSLVPLGLLAYLNYQHTRSVLIEDARAVLLATVKQTAADIDLFFTNNLDAVRTEAQLPALIDFLRLPSDKRPASPEAQTVASTLHELRQKDKIFIDSYAILDEQGRNILDTQPVYQGMSEAERDYFQKTIETGLPYASPVQFTSQPDTGQDQAAFYFSHPIYDPEDGAILGVLRIRYKTNVLQKLIVQHNGVLGPQSFAILFDENQIRLAHGLEPTLLFTLVTPPSAAQIARLQAEQRLPGHTTGTIATNLTDLAAGLDEAIFTPFFTARLGQSKRQLNLVAVTELDTQPWLVTFAQPMALFLVPIQAQTQITLFVAIAMAGIVAAFAFVMGRALANPLANLTQVVTRFTAGDLEARATSKSQDESGLLAASFNAMAAQVGSLLKRLEDRTHDLEASEEKYRTLFEDSRDPIFISTPEGHIVDINPIGVQLSGYTYQQLKQMHISQLYFDPKALLALRTKIETHGAARDFEVKLRRKDGTIRDCLVTATLRQTNEGVILGYQGIIRDITEQKQAERERLRLSAIERELSIAHEIQDSLLPAPNPNWAHLDMLCYSTPAREVGGDFYAYHAFGDTHFGLAVGDVSGKGISAALLMSISLASFQSSVGQRLAPGDLLTYLDQTIGTYTSNTSQNCALSYIEIEAQMPPHSTHHPASQNLIWTLSTTNAGCITPFIRRATGQVEWIQAQGLPLGTNLSLGLGYQPVQTQLYARDMVILVSDGIVEAQDAAGELFGFERLEAAIANGPVVGAPAMSAHLQETLAAFVGDSPLHDDVTIVVAQI